MQQLLGRKQWNVILCVSGERHCKLHCLPPSGLKITKIILSLKFPINCETLTLANMSEEKLISTQNSATAGLISSIKNTCVYSIISTWQNKYKLWITKFKVKAGESLWSRGHLISQASDWFSLDSSQLRIKSMWSSCLVVHYTLAGIFHSVLMSSLTASQTLSVFPPPYLTLITQRT